MSLSLEELSAQILEHIKERPCAFFMIEKEFRVRAAPMCKHGRYGPKDIRTDLFLSRILQDLRKAGRIAFIDHLWRYQK